MEELSPYPYLLFEQESIMLLLFRGDIQYCEQAEEHPGKRQSNAFNLLIGLNGYTVSSGVIDPVLNGPDIIAVPLKEGDMHIGYITHRKSHRSRLGTIYVEALKTRGLLNDFF